MTSHVHPDHDRLVHAVHDWFHGPYHAMGYHAEKRRWGTYWNIGQVYTPGVPAEHVQVFLADVREYYGPRPVCINVDSREVDATLGPVLCAAGCAPDTTDIFLAHVGSVPHCAAPEGVTIEPVTASNLREFADTRLKAFANTEEPLPEEAVRDESAQRQAELPGVGRGWLARLQSEPAGIIWWYDDPQDLWVLWLGVRLPFRRQGIGRWLLCTRLGEAYGRGCRSVMLNVRTENVEAMRLYHRLGFRDEIYWRQRYRLGNERRG